MAKFTDRFLASLKLDPGQKDRLADVERWLQDRTYKSRADELARQSTRD